MTTETARKPLTVLQERHGAAVLTLDAAARKLAATPEHEKAQTIARAAQLHHDLTKAQLAEARARRDVLAAEAELGRLPGNRRASLLYAATLPVWGPLLAIGAFGLWALALAIMLCGLVVFIGLVAVARTSHLAHRAGESASYATEVVGMAGVRAVQAAAGPFFWIMPGTARRLREQHEQRVARWEDAAVTLLAAERGMPYTQVYPLAGFTSEEADRVELAVAVIRREDRAAS